VSRAKARKASGLARLRQAGAVIVAGRFVQTSPGTARSAAGVGPGGDQFGVVSFGHGAAFAFAAAVDADPVEQAAARAGLETGQPGHRQPPGALAGHRDHGGLPAAGPGAGPGRAQGLAGLVLEADPRPGRRR
jgi:hypothetical protein